MAITFVQQKRKQRYLLFLFVIIVLLTLGVFWMNFLGRPPETPSTLEPAQPPPPKVDFKTLEDAFLQEAEEFPDIPPFIATGEFRLGRENPFVPYGEIVKLKKEEKGSSKR